MKRTMHSGRSSRVWLTEESCDLDAFRRIVERSVNRAEYPLASDVCRTCSSTTALKRGAPPPRPRGARN